MDKKASDSLINAFGPGPACPPLDELFAMVDGSLGSTQQSQAETHVATCAHCAAELSLLADFQSSAPRPDEQAQVSAIVAKLRQNSPVERKHWWKKLWQPMFLAPASLALAALLVVMVVGIPSSKSSAPDFTEGREVMRAGRVDIIGPAGTVTTVPQTLQWKPVQGASLYRVRLTEVDNTELWSASVPTNSATMPATVTKQIVPLKTLHWSVTALDGAGRVLAESSFQRFSLEPR